MIKVLFGMPRGDADAAAAEHDAGGRKAHHHGRHPAPQQLAREGRDLGRVVQHHGHHRRVVVPVDVQAHADERGAHAVAVLPQGLQLAPAQVRAVLPLPPSPAQVRAVLPHDDPDGGEDLLGDDRRERVLVQRARAARAEVIDQRPVAGDVASHPAEGLGEGAHHDVDVGGVHAAVLAGPAARGAQRADAVRLVQVQVRLVPLADLNDALQVADLALHRVDALHHDQHLLPGAAGARLPQGDRLPQHLPQSLRVVVGEGADLGPRGAAAGHDRGVVQRVRHD
eukprot:CAMPEP_0194596312 /NCGR_PEP_ID=MMETSP0292-20121207/25589_1 /TAXON_ID=39354 /ORGANISM="Heterosigma akashiwo, Strain CCMP2393" /LENGTH=281 /DNA_ID=CAMNT_0039456559 /DNA_START=372 /DNA_END=1218 /DNA_ORIENTATION=-